MRDELHATENCCGVDCGTLGVLSCIRKAVFNYFKFFVCGQFQRDVVGAVCHHTDASLDPRSHQIHDTCCNSPPGAELGVPNRHNVVYLGSHILIAAKQMKTNMRIFTTGLTDTNIST